MCNESIVVIFDMMKYLTYCNLARLMPCHVKCYLTIFRICVAGSIETKLGSNSGKRIVQGSLKGGL